MVAIPIKRRSRPLVTDFLCGEPPLRQLLQSLPLQSFLAALAGSVGLDEAGLAAAGGDAAGVVAAGDTGFGSGIGGAGTTSVSGAGSDIEA